MDTWQMIGAIVIAVVLGGILAVIFWRERERVKKEVKNPPPSGNSSLNSLQLQLQAYERLILLTERIALPNLISRMNQPGLAGKDMQMMLTHTIKQEFEHNITQQIYVSSEAWEAVRNLKEQNIHIINQVASYLAPDVSGTDLNKQLLEMIVQNPKVTLHNVVAEVLGYEAKKLMQQRN
jgi:uncharacterized membrane protein YraQ (UPF0718 family)